MKYKIAPVTIIIIIVYLFILLDFTFFGPNCADFALGMVVELSHGHDCVLTAVIPMGPLAVMLHPGRKKSL